MCNVAANEPTLELVGRMHHHEAAGGGINNDFVRLCGGSDQSFDETDWLHMRIEFAINFLYPTIWDSMIGPGCTRLDRQLLHHQ